MSVIEKKIDKLVKIYDLFDEIISEIDVHCRIKCDTCCTCNVAITQLEGLLILERTKRAKADMILNRVRQNFPKKRYQPLLTTNMFARFCVEGQVVPDEENDPAWGKCPLLEDGQCSIYPLRPFGCRALLSQVSCRKMGEAQVPELLLTYQNIFMQAIEQLDVNGIFGNLSDVILTVAEKHQLLSDDPEKIISKDISFPLNEPIKVLMVPPEHRNKTAELIKRLSGILK